MSAIAHRPHRVTSAIADARASLSSVADAPVWSMDAAETTAAIAEVTKVESQLAELKARLLAHADRSDIRSNNASTSTANWHAVATTTTRAAAHRAVWVAKALDTHELTRAALAEGRVHPEQAEVILRALADLPKELDPEVAVAAEQRLLADAESYDAKGLRHLGRHILHVISPETGDAHEAKLLEKEERDAAAATRLVMWDDGHGQTHGRFTLDTLSGAMLKKALFALAAPRHQASRGPLPEGERLPTAERLGQAFTEYIQRYPTRKLPKAGGVAATVVVLLDYDSLIRGLKAAQLDTGEKISAGQARRLACEARIIPAVLDGKSKVLDLGTKNRFFNEAQRIVKTNRSRQLRGRGLRHPSGHDPDAAFEARCARTSVRSPHQMDRRRPDQPTRRHDALPLPPPPSPRPALPDQQAPHRQVRLPPQNVSRPPRSTVSAPDSTTAARTQV